MWITHIDHNWYVGFKNKEDILPSLEMKYKDYYHRITFRDFGNRIEFI